MRGLAIIAVAGGLALAACGQKNDTSDATAAADAAAPDAVSAPAAGPAAAIVAPSNDLAADGAQSANAGSSTETMSDSAAAPAPWEDHRWYIVSMKTHECVLVSAVFGVATPREVQQKYAKDNVPLDTIRDNGDKEDGDIVMLGDSSHPLLNPMGFVKGKNACVLVMNGVRVRNRDDSPSD